MSQNADNQSEEGPVPCPFIWYANSQPFKFIVGPRKLEFMIHSALIAKQSPKLYALVNIGMKESVEQCVHWEEEDPETFMRFGDFVYSGKYYVEKPQKRRSEASAGIKRTAPEGFSRNDKEPKYSTYYRPAEIENLFSRFNRMYPTLPEPRDHIDASADKDSGPVFLAHAKVYVFAKYHDIRALQILSLRNLRELLSVFQLTTESLPDFVKLFKYCFDNTSDHGKRAGDELQNLLCLYAAGRMAQLNENDEFRGIVESKCSLLLIDQLVKR